MSDPNIDYPCIGVCLADPETGICIGCGRPPEPVVPRPSKRPELSPGAEPTDGETPAPAAGNG